MSDPTEGVRRAMVAEINGAKESDDVVQERARLEAKYGRVWDTSELTKEFEVQGFAAPIIVVRKRDTGQKGSLTFQHSPRFYFDWVPHNV